MGSQNNLKRRVITSKSTTGGSSGGITGANNGLSVSGSNVQLGGTLIQATSVALDAYSITFQNSLGNGNNLIQSNDGRFTLGRFAQLPNDVDSVILGNNHTFGLATQSIIFGGQNTTDSGSNKIILGQGITFNGSGIILGNGFINSSGYNLMFGRFIGGVSTNFNSGNILFGDSVANSIVGNVQSNNIIAGSFAAQSSTSVGSNNILLGNRNNNNNGFGVLDDVISVGRDNENINSNQVTIGRFVRSQSLNSIVLGSGVNIFNRLDNIIDNSMVVGFNSITPTVQMSATSSNYWLGTGGYAWGRNSSTVTRKFEFYNGATELFGISTGGQQTSDATFTATANNVYAYGLFGTVTARNTASDDLFGWVHRQTFVASANNQRLIASRRRPTFNVGAFTGIVRVLDYIENGGGGINFYQAIESPSNFARFGFGNQTLGSVSATVESVGETNSSSTFSFAAWTNGKGIRNWAVRDDGPMVLRNIGATRAASDGLVQYTGTDYLGAIGGNNFSFMGYSTYQFLFSSAAIVNGDLAIPIAGNNRGIAIPFDCVFSEISVDFSTLGAAAAQSITIDVREVTTGSAGIGSDYTSALGTSKLTVAYSTAGASATTFHRTAVATGTNTGTQGNSFIVACTAQTLTTCSFANVSVTIKRR